MIRFFQAGLVLSVLLLTGCGFQPLYGKGSSGGASASVQDYLAATKVENIPGREGQLLRIKVEDLLGSDYGASPARSLTLTLKKTRRAVAVEKDARIVRYHMILSSHYTLKDIASDQVITSGSLEAISGYSVVDSDFATHAAELDAIERAIGELAEGIRQRMIVVAMKQDEEQ